MTRGSEITNKLDKKQGNTALLPSPLHLLVVFTGGTIASRTSDAEIVLNAAPYQLLDIAPRGEFTFDSCEPFSILSENMTPDRLVTLFLAIRQAISSQKYHGIIITHGTDTLAFTAQLGYLLLSGLPDLPAIFMGSKVPLDNPKNDGQFNFLNSLALIKKIHARQVPVGVYVIGQSDDGQNYIHSAGSVIQADAQTDDICSHKNQYVGIFSEGVLINNPDFRPMALPNIASSRKECPPCTTLLLEALVQVAHTMPECQTVLLLDAYVGADYRNVNLSRPEFDFVIHRLYHSGTACTHTIAPNNSPPPTSLLYLQEQCQKHEKQLFIVPLDSGRKPYETTTQLLEAGVKPIFDLPVEGAWARLLLCTWLKGQPEDFL